MNTQELNTIQEQPNRRPARFPLLMPDRLRMVSTHELDDLRCWLARGQIPRDLEAKLAKLTEGDLGHRAIEQNCRTIFALLQAVDEGCFKASCPGDHERLLRVLAYVRKDDDAIPDYQPDGFIDDLQE